MAPRILCVAEKNSIAKAVAQHLSGGACQRRDLPGLKYNKNYEFNFSFGPPWGQCDVVMTSVSGHLTGREFTDRYQKWNQCTPDQLFDAPIITTIDKHNRPIAKNIENEARNAKGLFIWTDCDREGEHIGTEIREAARRGNPRIEVKRARFSNIERAHILRAAQGLLAIDERQANAVEARIELDLRIGAAFSRLQTTNIQSLSPALQERVISYGSCQFPTLGFVVDRYFRVKDFVPEAFWSIKTKHKRDNIEVLFTWQRGRLFDRIAVTILFERCLVARSAEVVKVTTKPTSKWRPLPLTTLELQKMGSRCLRMDSNRVMTLAEDLYNKGFISYPRTETDQFDKGMDLRKLVEKQIVDHRWGTYAGELTNGKFLQPRVGRNNDKAHPPIHPLCAVDPTALGNDESRRVYEFITRRFLACCSEDARGEATDVGILYGDENFHTHGLTVVERNYLDVYPYEKWESTEQLPKFRVGERFNPDEAMMTEGKTSPPGYLTEPELLALMDANGIGTDATMPEHIAKVKTRGYVMTRTRGEAAGRSARSATNAQQEFIPTTLGVALVKGYERVGLETSLSKPFLRKEMESKMKDICAGTKTRNDVVQESLDQYREVYIRTSRHIDILKAACPRQLFLGLLHMLTVPKGLQRVHLQPNRMNINAPMQQD
ncbi:MAG: DNA topoisomerase [Piccolia ochrophora]|nr:MAG: DNA topoisomerase [Piccolia ochrophora]